MKHSPVAQWSSQYHQVYESVCISMDSAQNRISGKETSFRIPAM